MDIANIRSKISGWIGKYKYLVLVLLAGVGLMLIPGNGDDEQTVPEQQQTQINHVSVAEELENILSNIQGAGKVQVMLSVKAGEQTVYQTDAPGEDRKDTVIITEEDRSQNGLVQQVISPTYRGAIILCQGADSANVCLAIKDAVSKITGLDSSQISVLKMK